MNENIVSIFFLSCKVNYREKQFTYRIDFLLCMILLFLYSWSMSSSFVHLHVHTQFSLLDGAIKTAPLVEKCKQLDMPAVAMTDHGNLYGAVAFYMDAKKKGVNPILGCEMYLAPYQSTDKKEFPGRKNSTHLVLLAENDTGWHNLTKLVSRAHLEGVYYKPRTDRDSLREFSEGLICLTGCLGGPLNEWLLQGEYQKASETLAELKDIFGEKNLYVELQDHGDSNQKMVLPLLIQLAKEHGLPVVATNDAHFLEKDDHAAHDVLICIGMAKNLLDPDRMRYSTEVYLKSPEEMRAIFVDIPEACDATLEIAARCQVDLKLDATSSEKYPQFPTPDGSLREVYLKKICFEGLVKRYGQERADSDKELCERLEYEIDIINQLGFASYFLITADFINWAKEQGIPVGPGRGSAAGSLVAYTMGITDICPMRFGLLFERFLNPERVSPPDIDIDFCQTRRPEVIDYVRNKYGERSVSNIITYGKLGAKSVIRDVARVLGVSYGEADALAKMIETGPKIKLKEEYEKTPELRAVIDSSDIYKELWEYATKLEGLVRNVGVHAAGVVIGDRPLDEHVPLTRDGEGSVVAQFDMSAITEVGLLKMDFLGLKNLTVIQDAVNHIRRHTPDFDISKISLEDEKTFDLLNAGETMGVFQLESGGMVDTCRRYGITRIEDIIDLLALYRPGAMQFIDQMILVKKGVNKPFYEHPLLETVCGDTYGVMIYQEQVQNAAKLLAGYTLGGADVLRRVMGKKKVEEMNKQRSIFAEGCLKTNGIKKELADKIFEKIESFAGYGFNKSHSACYGHISYWTAYLKANFPVEFMAGLLSNEINNTDKIGVFVSECNSLGIEILPPDVNKSDLRFSPELLSNGKWAIRYGLSAVKNVGEGAMELLIKDRGLCGEYKSLEDLSKRLETRSINKKVLESLVRAGAFDWTREFRAALFERIDKVLGSSSVTQRDLAMGQGSLFDIDETLLEEKKSFIPEWPKDKRLADEKELLGFYVTGHPLDAYRSIIDSSIYRKIGLLDELDIENGSRKKFAFAGMVRQVSVKTTKAGKRFAIIVLEDFTGSAEVLFWSETYEKTQKQGSFLVPGNIIAVKASVQEDDRTGSRRVAASDVREIKLPKKEQKTDVFTLVFSVIRHTREDLLHVLEILKKYPGEDSVVLEFRNGFGNSVAMIPSQKFSVHRSRQLEEELSGYL